MPLLSHIFIYPIKSLSAIELKKSALTREGLFCDRRWMLVDDDGLFITQREFPILNLLKIQELENEFLVTDPGQNFLLIPKEINNRNTRIMFNVKIWEAQFDAEVWDPYASQWFSNYLEKRVVLVKMILNHRIKKMANCNLEFPVNFSDGYPIHIINTSSVNKVSEWAEEKIDPMQFRPNFIFDQLNEFEEDRIRHFSVGDQKFEILKQTERCIMSTLIPNTAEFRKEPLSALSKFNRANNKVSFGIYAIPVLEKGQENYSNIAVNQNLQIEFR
ncbi:MAG: MOSC N-terminal beta barrel domain-containing protein [Saprospiraceae bacterium]|nr:MOSC N-terminal beta barrel domain-containing protein [Saprospiraceae bacterium]